jgi:hypothetical protein
MTTTKKDRDCLMSSRAQQPPPQSQMYYLKKYLTIKVAEIVVFPHDAVAL